MTMAVLMYFPLYLLSKSVSSNDTPQDEDVILLLTHEAYYVARYCANVLNIGKNIFILDFSRCKCP